MWSIACTWFMRVAVPAVGNRTSTMYRWAGASATLSTHTSRSYRPTSAPTSFIRSPGNDTLNVRTFDTLVR